MAEGMYYTPRNLLEAIRPLEPCAGSGVYLMSVIPGRRRYLMLWCLRLPCVAVILVCVIRLLTERGYSTRE